MKPVRKKLIEVSIPLEAINKASAREKSIRHGHPSTLHLWWARRPLAACRAVLFAQLVDDPSSWPDRFPTEEAQDIERRRLHRIIEDMVPWEASNNETILNAARWEIARSVAWGFGEEPPAKGDGKAILDYLQTKAPPVYDPFSGGGSIPLEAQRLGLRAYGSDINPVAILIGKALVEVPPKFAGAPPVNPSRDLHKRWKGAQGLADDVRYYGQWMKDKAEEKLSDLYPKAKLTNGSEATVVAWLWARSVRSPDPSAKGAMVPLVSSFILSSKEGKKAWVEPIIDPSQQDGYRFEVRTGKLSKADEARLSEGTKVGRGSNFRCLLSGAAIDTQYVKDEGVAGRMKDRLLAIVSEGKGGRNYTSPDEMQESVAMNVIRPDGVADLMASTHPQYMGCVNYGLDNFSKMFLPRQATTLAFLADLIEPLRQEVLRKAVAAGLSDSEPHLKDGGCGAAAYADAVATYLGLVVGRCANYWSEFNFWTGDFIVQTFGRQALSIIWDHAEVNPFSSSTGNFGGAIDWTAKALELSAPASGFGSITEVVAQNNNYPTRPVVISTDPPYYDNIPYADLSDFFYVWLRQSLKGVWPELFRRLSVPKNEELVADSKRHGGRDEADLFFMKGMEQALTAMSRAAHDDDPLAIYYAFKQASEGDDGVASAGWASFLQAILDSGLAIAGTWPIRTERPGGGRNAKRNSLASSVVLVCRKRHPDATVTTRSEFLRELRRELPDAIEDIRKAGVGPVDMQQSVIGPGMGVFSSYLKVLEDDDSAMPVRTALALINRVWEEIDQELDAAFDPETQVALAWFATYGFDARQSGELITLANAKNIASNALFVSGVFMDLKGKTALTPRDELPKGWTPAADKTLTVWECVQHTARVLNAEDGGGAAAGRLVAEMGPKAADARALAYRLFEIATQKGWAAEALIYNQLAQEWPKLEDLASTAQSQATTATAQAELDI
jgi:putative DNA methylase